jgi:hypothetical protein
MMMMLKRTNKVRRNKMAKLIGKVSLPPSHPLFSSGFSITSLRKPMKPTEETKEDTEEKKTPESDNPSNRKE